MRSVFIVFILVVFVACACSFQQHAPFLLNQIKSLGWLGPLFFLLIYCLATLLFLPTMVLTLAGGALFGPVMGTLLNLAGATLGAGCAFCISRYLANDWFTHKKGIRHNRLIQGVEKRGWQFVAVLRLVPLVPFNLVNYGLGMTRIRLSHYLLTTLIFLAPGEVIYTYCGHAGMDALINAHSIYSYVWPLFSLIACLGAGLVIKLTWRSQHAGKVQPGSPLSMPGE
ncbi:TVP38/TMEM64 family protein [Legionella taurinensis]|uniref:TVP38/TMEM64 family membrane protein n=1 Tax=Legionella taurinensis TaxID=70611 RepID=A0A3A5LGV0_9GAMM|nr:TVP38/TMEM64 family protein [Legionella taurinensis]MDX1837509.1 TVP38/TMEM64 family protein [Legionella taurinensis]PUT40850.1 TVP38/TMEM64 family protein [Legionella taurinensis]PUT44271.1 TVP38/TMEM64 family protein [Legionella taurinensis]PUT47573.1 TVP38/TMEM64 family protein [Legionella taurinensis]PUT48712.1 TVP38/TMEM64 family protein [Legionella taurinensis]